jgi:ABC-type branched-subunit amino acid transport system substrate-binding protein
MSTVLSGPTADLGQKMRDGVLAALEEANRAGGVQGHPLELIALDDGYEPTRTAPNMRELIEQRHVLAVVGNVGTPTAVAAIPIAMENRTPFYGAFSGAGVLRKTPPDRYVINYRASYAEETAAMVDALTGPAGLHPEEIAFFTQRDAYGDAGFNGGLAALKRHQLKSETGVAHVRYERNTLAVENALADLLLHRPAPRAVILVGAYAPCAAFIRLAKQNDFNALFLNVSFVGPSSLAKALGSDGEGVIVTQVVPPVESSLPAVNEFRAAMRARGPEGAASYGSLEGYLSMRLFCRALRNIEGELDREKVVDALEGLGAVDIGLGESVRLSREEHQASHRVWATIVRGGRLVPLRWEELAPAHAALAPAPPP